MLLSVAGDTTQQIKDPLKKSQPPACSAQLRTFQPGCKRHGENEVMPVEHMPFIHINNSWESKVLDKESGCPDNGEQFSRIQGLHIYLHTDLGLHWHSAMQKIINFSIFSGFPEYRIGWGGLYLPHKGLWRETSSGWSISSPLLAFLQHTVKPSQRCCFIFFPSGNTTLQASKYNWQFPNTLPKSPFSFQAIFPNPISHITFSAPRRHSSSLIKCSLCCPAASLCVFNPNPSLTIPNTFPVLPSIPPAVNTPLLMRAQHPQRQQTSAY